MTIEPLESKHVEDASLLFTRRYRGRRERQPLLPSRCGRKEIAAFLLKEIIKENRGVAALCGSRLVGYLVGHAGISGFKGIHSGVYVPEWGHGAEGAVRPIYRRMYEDMARLWIGTGCFTHAVTLFSDDETCREFFSGMDSASS